MARVVCLVMTCPLLVILFLMSHVFVRCHESHEFFNNCGSDIIIAKGVVCKPVELEARYVSHVVGVVACM